MRKTIAEVRSQIAEVKPEPPDAFSVTLCLCGEQIFLVRFARPAFCRGDALGDGGMRMKKPLHPARRRLLGQILIGQFGHRRNEWLDAGDGSEAIAVGLALIKPRVGIQRGHQQEREHRRNQHQQRQVRKIRHRLKHVPALDGIIQHFARQVESEKGNYGLHENALQNMAMDVMPEFVRQHGLNLVVGVVVEQSVGEDDATRRSQPGQRCIRLLAFLR